MPKLKYIRQNVFQILSILTVGFPFVGYKVFGGIIISHMYDGTVAANIVAMLFIVWGLVDFVLNAVGLYTVCCRGEIRYPVCLLSLLSQKHHFLSRWRDVGEAVDTLLSFSIVALVVGKNLFVFLDGAQVKVWNICTVVNVLGAGVARLGTSLLVAG